MLCLGGMKIENSDNRVVDGVAVEVVMNPYVRVAGAEKKGQIKNKECKASYE
jgi:hypothetical protein